MSIPKGYKYKNPKSLEHRKSLSESAKKWHRDNPFSKEYRERQSEVKKKWHRDNPDFQPMLGKVHSTETRRKISESTKGRIPWNKGKHHSVETRKKLSKAREGKHDEFASNWKGGRASYYGRIAHRAWEDYWGEIVPKGYVIHHIDEDITNNHIANLTCMSRGKHTALHRKRKSSGSKQLIPMLTYKGALA